MQLRRIWPAVRWNDWRLLYTGLTPLRASVTQLDPSENLQISLQIPLTDDVEDWDLWIEACNRQLSVPLRQWLEEQRSPSGSAKCCRWPAACRGRLIRSNS
ncbi:hypothetical protein SynA15127_01056 [Synechococcus sp. A15-127]|nr:hypothetical protein SynA15127_01056 [Synechococcus sp. A15-127]